MAGETWTMWPARGRRDSGTAGWRRNAGWWPARPPSPAGTGASGNRISRLAREQYGNYVLIIVMLSFHPHLFFRYSNGAEYTGDWVNNLYHGLGVLQWSNGDSFYGQFRYGSMHGVGWIYHMMIIVDILYMMTFDILYSVLIMKPYFD